MNIYTGVGPEYYNIYTSVSRQLLNLMEYYKWSIIPVAHNMVCLGKCFMDI